jgi:AcrR family transcriptional regulator
MTGRMTKAITQGGRPGPGASPMPAVERGHQVRRRLRSAAVELIVERGWTGVSTRALAERAGVAPGLVHYHFPSLQGLLAEAAADALCAAATALRPVLEQAGTPQEAVEMLLRELDHYTGRDPVSLLFAETYLAATRDEALARMVGGLLTDFRSDLAAWLGERSVPDPAATAAVLTAAIDGILLHRAMDPAMTADMAAPVLRRLCPVTRQEEPQ